MACALAVPPAHAYDRERAKVTLAGELADCAAYFIVVAEFVEHHGRPQVADNAAMTAEVLLDGSVALVGDKATQTSYEGARQRHLALLKDPGDFPRVVERYNASCLAIFRDPGLRMQYWLDKL